MILHYLRGIQRFCIRFCALFMVFSVLVWGLGFRVLTYSAIYMLSCWRSCFFFFFFFCLAIVYIMPLYLAFLQVGYT